MVLDGHVLLLPLEVGGDLLLKELPNLRQLGVAALVRLSGVLEQVTARTLGHYDHSIALSVDDLIDEVQHPQLTMQREGHLGNETQVHLTTGEVACALM